MNHFLQAMPSPFRTLFKRISCFIFGAVLTICYAQIVQAQTTGSRPVTQNPYSIETIIAAVIAAVITIVFLRGMYLVLTYASQTYGLEEEENSDESQENNALLYGAFGWVLGSALLIASYGLGWGFLYLGPILCLLGPVVPIVAMNLDIQKYKQVLDNQSVFRRSPFN